MTSAGTPFDWNSHAGQALLGLAGCVLSGVVFLVGGLPVVLGLALLLFVPAPALIIGFVAVSYFRIPEAYPILLALKLPLAFGLAALGSIILTIVQTPEPIARGRTMWLALAGLASLGAGILLMGNWAAHARLPIIVAMVLASGAIYAWYRTLDTMNAVPWRAEVPLTVAFFVIVAMSVALSIYPANSVHFWNQSFWKIVVMTLVLAWLIRSATDFRLALWILVGSGGLIALKTGYNWYHEIDLVEGTRVTIGRTLFSTPEDIANAVPGQAIQGGSQLGDPNDLALVLLYPVGLALGVLLKVGIRTGLGTFCLVVLPMLILAIIATQSRGGALGVVTVFATVGMFYVRSKLVLALAAVIGIFGLVIAMDIGSRQSGGLAEIETEGIDRSALERLHAWSAAISMTAHRPLRGVGLDNFSSQFRTHTPVWSGRNMAAHSTWFEVMAETGLAGIALLIAIVLALLRSLWRTWNILKDQDADPVYAAFCIGLLAGLLGFCASGTFLSQGFRWPLYLQIGFTAALACTALQLRNQNRRGTCQDEFG